MISVFLVNQFFLSQLKENIMDLASNIVKVFWKNCYYKLKTEFQNNGVSLLDLITPDSLLGTQFTWH